MSTAILEPNKNNNIDLVIIPEKSTSPFNEAVVKALITESEYVSLQINDANIKSAIAELNSELKALAAGLKGRQIKYEVLERKDATIIFKINDDNMEASAEITTAMGGKHLSAKAIHQEAQTASIVKGFIKEELISLAQKAAKAQPGTEIKGIIAKGRTPINGKDTKIKPLVESAQARILKPKERDDGSVDMRDLGDIICVKVGDPLVKRIPYTKGFDGYTVTGTILEPTPGEDCQLVAGEGTEYSPKDGDILISTLVGLPKVIENGMQIDQIYQIKDVDIGTGHIKFEGSVIISGDVKEGMKVTASGDINIAGFVESAYLEAGNDITIQKGIIGKKQEVDEINDINDIQMSAVINAKGNIYATYSQYAEINTSGNLRIENQLMHNILNIDGHVWVGKEEKANGKFIGGHANIGEYVSAGIVGATAGSKTIISFEKKVFGFKYAISSIDERLKVESDKAQELQVLTKKLKDLPKANAKPDMLAKVISTYRYHCDAMASILREKELAEQELQEYMTSVFIEGTEKIYHGVEIRVGDFHDRSKREYGPTKLTYGERKIHFNPIVNT